MAEFRMPSLGADMESAVLVEWKVRPGDRVERNQLVAVVETAKGAIDIEIFEDGVIDELAAVEGEEVPVGDPLATYHRPGEAAGKTPGEPPEAATTRPPPSAPSKEAAATSPAPGTAEHVKASPAARRHARDLGVDIAQLSGSGPEGAIVLSDVEGAAGETGSRARARTRGEAAEKPAGPAAPMRDAIGSAMARSKREIPHYYLGTEIRLARAMAWLEHRNARRAVEQRLIPAALLYRAVVLALRTVPALNGTWDDGPQRSDAVHLGVAISLRKRGLFAPAVMHAEKLSVDELMAALRDLTARARSGGLRASELSSPTITVTNLGDRGVDTVYPVIYPPQLAIVGFGRITARVVAEDNTTAVRPVVTATMAGDHRASDGYHGSKFLNEIDKRLQSPEEL